MTQTPSASHSQSRRLEALGVPASVEAAYVELLRGAAVTADDPEAEGLVAADLAADSGGLLVPLPVENALGAWQRRRAVEEMALREPVRFFDDLYQSYAQGSRQVTVLRGGEAVSRASRRLHSGARAHVHTLERGPFWGGPDVTVTEDQPAASKRGVRYRTLYQADLLNVDRIVDIIRQSVALGEEARSYHAVPIRLMVADDAKALLVLPQPVSADDPLRAVEVDGLLVEQPTFVAALARLFDAFWNRGVPLTMLDGPASPSDDTHDILNLLALGMTDASIARAMQISERTVLRRISALMESAGVRTRFQLGAHLARAGALRSLDADPEPSGDDDAVDGTFIDPDGRNG